MCPCHGSLLPSSSAGNRAVPPDTAWPVNRARVVLMDGTEGIGVCGKEVWTSMPTGLNPIERCAESSGAMS